MQLWQEELSARSRQGIGALAQRVRVSRYLVIEDLGIKTMFCKALGT